LGIYSFCD